MIITGRTIPSFRIALHLEQKKWKDFRDALEKKEKMAFDEIFTLSRLYISTCMMSCRPIRLQPIMMAIIFHHYKQLLGMIKDDFEGDKIEYFPKR